MKKRVFAVTIKALIRVLGDLIKDKNAINNWASSQNAEAFAPILNPLSQIASRFRSDGFYERFHTKGQLERTTRIYRVLSSIIGLEKAVATE